VLATYVILGTFLEGIAMLVLTLPIVYPVILSLGYSPIWFGVMVVIVLEMGLLSPPVGVNVFVVKGVAPDVPLNTIFRGIWPFWFAMLLSLALLVIFPRIALFLPEAMF
jgi:TRAP-type C4-dicarboxylate transport system permease large subunit